MQQAQPAEGNTNNSGGAGDEGKVAAPPPPQGYFLNTITAAEEATDLLSPSPKMKTKIATNYILFNNYSDV